MAVLYPAGIDYGSVSIEEFTEEISDVASDPETSYSQGADSPNTSTEVLGAEAEQEVVEAESDDLNLSTANSYKPSSMAVSFLVDLPNGSEIVVEASGGRYKKKTIQVGGSDRTWWLRQPVTMESRFSSEDISSNVAAKIPSESVQTTNCDELKLEIEAYSRPHDSGSSRLLTVCLINRQEYRVPLDESCLFQSHFRVTVSSPNGAEHILPYPSADAKNPDAEEQSLALLYRRYETFGVGHGCAADWEANPATNRAYSISAEALPEFETPSITPDVYRGDGTLVEVSMAALAGLIPGEDGFAALSEVIELYERWIGERDKEISELPETHEDAAKRNLQECRRCVTRMRLGLEYLRSDVKAHRGICACESGGATTADLYPGRNSNIIIRWPPETYSFLRPIRGPICLEASPRTRVLEGLPSSFLADGSSVSSGRVCS